MMRYIWCVFLVWQACSYSRLPYGLEERLPLKGLQFPKKAPTAGNFELVSAFPGQTFDRPVFLTHAGDQSGRLFVVEQRGVIKVVRPNESGVDVQSFLNISHKLGSHFGEQGLLGLAFDPSFRENGYFYVNYSGRGRKTVVSRFKILPDGERGDPESEKIVLQVSQPASNHNGGMIAFGPDGYLYIGMGDGGWGGDPQGHGQNTRTLLGAMLRIDVSGEGPYQVPQDNPFIGNSDYLPEIWAYGLRNPWRFSFDRLTGELWAADVGQDKWEEIDIIEKGKNYGWNPCEGFEVYQQARPCPEQYAPPLFVYPRSEGESVTGGYVYRGAALPNLRGTYLYADYLSRKIWALARTESGVENRLIARLDQDVASFGEDEAGEVYIVGYRGSRSEIFSLKTATNQFQDFPKKLSQTGLFFNTQNLIPNRGLIEYDVQAPLWSDGAAKRRWIGVPDETQIVFSKSSPWQFPIGTVLVKHFEIETTTQKRRRLETRVLVHHDTAWRGYTYRWNAEQTDAELLTNGQNEILTVPTHEGGSKQQVWSYPSPSDCMRCHTAVTGEVLGARTEQLNGLFVYPNALDNQLRSWNHIKLFTEDIGKHNQYTKFSSYQDASVELSTRARTYLEVNCANCHQPGAPAPVDIDLRYSTPLKFTNLVGVAPTSGDLGLCDSKRIREGDKQNSVLWVRMHLLNNEKRMPPLGSNVRDEIGLELLGSWIDAMAEVEPCK